MMSRSVRGVLAGRGFMLLPAAALAVHELRYRLAYGRPRGYGARLAGARLPRLARALARPAARARARRVPRPCRALGRGPARRASAAVVRRALAARDRKPRRDLRRAGAARGRLRRRAPGRRLRPLRPRRLVVARPGRRARRRRRRTASARVGRRRRLPHAWPPACGDASRSRCSLGRASALLAPRGVLACAAAGRAPPRL